MTGVEKAKLTLELDPSDMRRAFAARRKVRSGAWCDGGDFLWNRIAEALIAAGHREADHR